MQERRAVTDSTYTDQDKAGRNYWNETWRQLPLPPVWDIDSKRLRAYVERAFFQYISGVLKRHGHLSPETHLIEVGCARSPALPVLAKRLNIKVAGLDYSPNGCQQTLLMLEREGVAAEVYCHDLLELPQYLLEKFDVVVSFGLIEHFSSTQGVISILAKLVKPGGIIITSIPNMNGVPGFFQKVLNRTIFDIHMPLTPEDVCGANRVNGLDVLACGYFLATNFGVINLGTPYRRDGVWWFKKILSALLARISMGVWLMDHLGVKLPVSRAFSPYINCVAARPH